MSKPEWQIPRPVVAGFTALAVLPLASIVGFWVAAKLVSSLFRPPLNGVMLSILVLADLAGAALLARWVHRWIDPPPFEAPLCACCGYDLTGNVSGRCPECGTALTNEAEAP